MAILPGTRIRDNGVFGTITDNPLTAGAVTFNSADLVRLGVVSGNHAIVTLDPLRQFGEAEIVMVTAHTAAATVATIQRGMFGTTARSHPQGTLWVHAAADNDFVEVLTSATRPADQYEGQFIFETDTNKLVGFGGVDWAPRDAGGQLGYSESTTTVATSGATELTVFTVAVTVGTGRRIKVTWKEGDPIHTVASDQFLRRIKVDGVIFDEARCRVPPSAGDDSGPFQWSAVHTPTAGAHSYTATDIRELGTGIETLVRSATLKAWLLVEDIGAA